MKKSLALLFFFCSCLTMTSQEGVEISGSIVDGQNNPIKFASVSLTSRFLGTTTTEEGKFMLSLANINYDLKDIIEIASFGNPTLKITVGDFINLKNKIIVIGESNNKISINDDAPPKDKTIVNSRNEIIKNNKAVVSNTEFKLWAAKDYVELAYSNLGKNTINELHELKILYRRFSIEDEKARFLVEQSINVLDRGPLNGSYNGIDIVSTRMSEDHRFVKSKAKKHTLYYVGRRSPLREPIKISDYNWKITDNTSYDNESVVVVEGRLNDDISKFIRFYIGANTYGVYKIELSQFDSVYIYKKDENGKLYLSYHNRTNPFKIELTETQMKLYKSNKKIVKEYFKTEVFVLGIEKIKGNSFDKSNYQLNIEDFGNINTYDPSYWRKLSLPPETMFYKECIAELEWVSGKSIEKQFRKEN